MYQIVVLDWLLSSLRSSEYATPPDGPAAFDLIHAKHFRRRLDSRCRPVYSPRHLHAKPAVWTTVL